MKASEARKLTDAYSTSMDRVYNKIKAAATMGAESVNVGKDDYCSRDVLRVIHELEMNGYKVKREQGYDQRDGQSWDYLIVSW
jgi:hypothetical protein